MKSFTHRILNAIIASQTRKAEREIARYLNRSEFKNESYDYVLDVVRRGSGAL